MYSELIVAIYAEREIHDISGIVMLYCVLPCMTPDMKGSRQNHIVG